MGHNSVFILILMQTNRQIKFCLKYKSKGIYDELYEIQYIFEISIFAYSASIQREYTYIFWN